MLGLLFRRSVPTFLVFNLFVAISVSFERGQDHGIRSKTHLHEYSPPKYLAKQYSFLDIRDLPPNHYISVPFEKKQNIIKKLYGNQDSLQMESEGKIVPTVERDMNFEMNIRDSNLKSNGENTRKMNPNHLRYGDLKRAEDADQSVNELINSIIDDDKNLEMAMSDDAAYRKPTPSPSEHFDVTIDESAKNSVQNSFVHTKFVPEAAKGGGLQEASQVEPNDQTVDSSDGNSNGTRLAHSWSVQLDNADRADDGSHGSTSHSQNNGGNTEIVVEEAAGSNISSQIGNRFIAVTGKEDTILNVSSEAGDKVNNTFKESLKSSGSVLSIGGKKGIKSNNNNIIISNDDTKRFNLIHDATSHISMNNSLTVDNTNLGKQGDEETNNDDSNFSNKIHLVGEVKAVSSVPSNVTNVISSLQGEDNPTTIQDVAGLGNRAKNNSNTISSNKYFNEYGVGNGSHKSSSGNSNDSISNNGDVNVKIIEGLPNQDAQNGHLGCGNNSCISVDLGNTDNTLQQNGKDFIDIKQVENAATSSSFLKHRPNAFKILMEYFRKEMYLKQKLRRRLNALRKTGIEENAMKKSFTSAHEKLETQPTRPLTLRDFVADLFKLATENVSHKPNSQNILETKGFSRGKGELNRPVKADKSSGKLIVGPPRKVVLRPHNSVKAVKQSLPLRKTYITFLADFENVTAVAKEINGNITKIFQNAMNSNSQDGMVPEANASSALGLAEERIGKIIAQNEIFQNVVENDTSNTLTQSDTSNAKSKGVSNLLKGNAISMEGKVSATGQLGSKEIPNTTRRPLLNHGDAVLKIERVSNESNQKAKETFAYSTGETSPSEALYDFIHIKDSYMDSKTMMFKKALKSLEVSLSQDFFSFWMYHYRSLEEMGIKPEQLRSGIATVGSTGRLERVIKKALKGEIINILIVGGSISAGGGLERDRHDLHGIYYKAFVEWWKNTVTPITTSDLKLNVVAIGGTDSEYFSYCIKNYIQVQPDLVIWELAANDYRRYANREMDPAKPLEHLTRLLLTLSSHPALIFINFFRGDYYKTTLGQNCPDSEDEGGTRVAEYYKITSLSWRNIICSQIKNDLRPSNKGVKREFTPLTLRTLFSSDGYHPSLLGHAQCATLLISYIRSVFEEVVSREISRLDDGKAEDNSISNQNNLPKPIYSNVATPNNPMCWTLLTPNFYRQIENQLPGMRIIEANGFEFTNITCWPVRMDRLRCLKALHSDASLRIKFDVSRDVKNKSSTQTTDVAVISHNSFLGSARVWLDNDQYNAVNIDEPTGQRRTQANIIKRVLQTGSHVITIRSIAPGFCVSALAIR